MTVINDHKRKQAMREYFSSEEIAVITAALIEFKYRAMEKAASLPNERKDYAEPIERERNYARIAGNLSCEVF